MSPRGARGRTAILRVTGAWARADEEASVGELELWQSMGVALAIGLLIGAERERDRPGRTAGVRTFAVVAVVGSLAVQVPAAVAAVLCAGVAALVVVGYVFDGDRDRGITTEVAVLATLGLGALSRTAPAAAVAVAVAVTVVLVSRKNLHHFVRETVTDQERTDALIFFVAAFVVLPVLPSGPVGPYGAWVPQRIWLLVVLIIAIGWVGYAATRLLGARRGMMIGGLAGGFVSATATTGVMASRARRHEAPVRAALAGAVLASVATLVQLVLLTALVDVRVSLRLLPAAVAGGVVLLAEAWWLGRAVHGEEEDTPAGRPFSLVAALVLAAIISAVLPARAVAAGPVRRRRRRGGQRDRGAGRRARRQRRDGDPRAQRRPRHRHRGGRHRGRAWRPTRSARWRSRAAAGGFRFAGALAAVPAAGGGSWWRRSALACRPEPPSVQQHPLAVPRARRRSSRGRRGCARTSAATESGSPWTTYAVPGRLRGPPEPRQRPPPRRRAPRSRRPSTTSARTGT